MNRWTAVFIAALSIFAALNLSPARAAAKPDLVVYYCVAEKEAEVFIKKFEKKKNIKIQGREIKTGLLAQTLKKEGKDTPASVVFGGSLPAYISAKSQGLFQKYKSPVAKSFDKKFKDKDGMWTGIYVGIIAFATDKFSGLTPPQSWADLLKPEYKGKIGMPDPTYSGTGYTTIATIVQIMGEDKAFKYFKKLKSQVDVFTKSGSEPGKLVGKKQLDVGISFMHDILKVQEKSKNIEISFPKEGTGLEIGGIAIPKHAPNVKLAREFVDFLLSPEAQNMYGEGAIPPRYPTHPKAKNPGTKLVKKKITLFDFDFDWAGKHEQRLKARWKKEIIGK